MRGGGSRGGRDGRRGDRVEASQEDHEGLQRGLIRIPAVFLYHGEDPFLCPGLMGIHCPEVIGAAKEKKEGGVQPKPSTKRAERLTYRTRASECGLSLLSHTDSRPP